jgi:CheY-like chemotaxis protein
MVTFKIEAEQLDTNKVNLLISVLDTGVGIAKEKKHSIFDSFSQNNINNKRKFGGLGLGLYIVKTLVDMQGGTIDIDSTLGEGTECHVRLEYDVITQEKTSIMPLKSIVYDLEGKTILVVEDNPINQTVIKMITNKWLNTAVLYANDGQEALNALKSNTVDIVLMDLQMPVMDGYEATIAIRNGEAGIENKAIPIIALTADVMEDTKLRVSEIGMNHYLSKPITKELLYKVVKELL